MSFIVGAYLLGSISFAYLIGRAKGIDIRTVGSGNVGASNIGRTFGRRWGIFCFALDVIKGMAPVLLAGAVFGLLAKPLSALDLTTMWLWMAVGVAAIMGHMFSIFLKFRGGKGVATGFGFMLGVYPHLSWPVLAALAVWLVVIKLSRMISCASIVAALSLPIWFMVVTLVREAVGRGSSASGAPEAWVAIAHGWPFLVVTIALALLIVWKHRANIGRILAGTEPKVGAMKEIPAHSAAGSQARPDQ